MHKCFFNAPKSWTTNLSPSEKERGKMACQRSMTHNEEERKYGVPKKYDKKKMSEKDGVPKKYDPKKWRENQSRKKGLSSTLCTGLINK